MVYLNSSGAEPTKTTGEVKTPCSELNLGSLVGLLRELYQALHHEHTMVTSLTEMNIHLLGMLGMTVLKVKLLEVLKRLCEQQIPVPVECTISLSFPSMVSTFLHSVLGFLCRSRPRIHQTWQTKARRLNI